MDKDYDEHGNWTSAIENATQWLKDQFNPLIRDRTPPMITKFTLRWEVEFSVSLEPVKVYAHLHLVVRDVGGISYLYILDEDSGESITYTDAGSMLDINHKFKASILTATFGSVKISIIAEDNAHNVLSAEKELKGALKKVLDALRSLWNAIWNTLCKVAEAVMNAVNVIVEWVKGLIDAIIQKFLSPILSVVSKWINGFMVYLSEFINEITGRGKSNDTQTLAIKFAKAFFSSQMWTMAMAFSIAIVGIVTTINMLIKVFTGGASQAVDWILDAIALTSIKYTVMQGIAEAVLGGIFSIVSFFIPPDNPLWNGGLLMDIIGFIQIAINYAINYGLWSNLPFGPYGWKKPSLVGSWIDAFGLAIAIVIFFADIYFSMYRTNKMTNLTMSLVTTILSAIAFVITLLKEDFIDRFIGGVLSYIEEIICGIVMVYSSIILGKAIAEIVR